MIASSRPLESAPRLASRSELEAVLERPGLALVVKHSLTCGTSGAALREIEAAVESIGTELPIFVIEVQPARPLSNHLAERFRVRHESPQALLFKDGRLIWHASHWAIERTTVAALLSAECVAEAVV